MPLKALDTTLLTAATTSRLRYLKRINGIRVAKVKLLINRAILRGEVKA